MTQKTEYDRQVILDEMLKLGQKYDSESQIYVKTARKIEDTDMCMVTLPCRNKDKKLLILAVDI